MCILVCFTALFPHCQQYRKGSIIFKPQTTNNIITSRNSLKMTGCTHRCMSVSKVPACIWLAMYTCSMYPMCGTGFLDWSSTTEYIAMSSLYACVCVCVCVSVCLCVCVCVCVCWLNKLLINVLYEDLQMSVKLWTWSDNTASLAVSHNKEF